MAELSQMVKKDYGIKLKLITTMNPQANTIIERVHQKIGNILHTFNVKNIDVEDPWVGIMVAIMFAIRATFHNTM